MKRNPKILAIIPARAGSKRIPGKNTKLFFGKPLIAYTIEQALSVPFIDRVIVDTESEKIAIIAKKYGAEVPYLRPEQFATDKAQVMDAILHLLGRLNNEEGYRPDYIMILQTTSPLREVEDIERCWEMIRNSDATSVLTACSTHPRLYYVDKKNNLVLANKRKVGSTNIQAWPQAYLLNGCFVYIIEINALLKEKSVLSKKTKAVVCDRWRSVDLDEPEDWVMAELLYKHKEEIKKKLKKFK